MSGYESSGQQGEGEARAAAAPFMQVITCTRAERLRRHLAHMRSDDSGGTEFGNGQPPFLERLEGRVPFDRDEVLLLNSPFPTSIVDFLFLVRTGPLAGCVACPVHFGSGDVGDINKFLVFARLRVEYKVVEYHRTPHSRLRSVENPHISEPTVLQDFTMEVLPCHFAVEDPRELGTADAGLIASAAKFLTDRDIQFEFTGDRGLSGDVRFDSAAYPPFYLQLTEEQELFIRQICDTTSEQ